MPDQKIQSLDEWQDKVQRWATQNAGYTDILKQIINDPGPGDRTYYNQWAEINFEHMIKKMEDIEEQGAKAIADTAEGLRQFEQRTMTGRFITNAAYWATMIAAGYLAGRRGNQANVRQQVLNRFAQRIEL